MFKVHHINFGNSKEFATLDAARAFAIKTNFEAAITFNGLQVARYTPVSGWHYFGGHF
jgi:hypothetical protein